MPSRPLTVDNIVSVMAYHQEIRQNMPFQNSNKYVHHLHESGRPVLGSTSNASVSRGTIVLVIAMPIAATMTPKCGSQTRGLAQIFGPFCSFFVCVAGRGPSTSCSAESSTGGRSLHNRGPPDYRWGELEQPRRVTAHVKHWGDPFQAATCSRMQIRPLCTA